MYCMYSPGQFPMQCKQKSCKNDQKCCFCIQNDIDSYTPQSSLETTRNTNKLQGFMGDRVEVGSCVAQWKDIKAAGFYLEICRQKTAFTQNRPEEHFTAFLTAAASSSVTPCTRMSHGFISCCMNVKSFHSELHRAVWHESTFKTCKRDFTTSLEPIVVQYESDTSVMWSVFQRGGRRWNF